MAPRLRRRIRLLLSAGAIVALAAGSLFGPVSASQAATSSRVTSTLRGPRRALPHSTSSAHYVIVNRGNSLVLDATNCGTANGTVVRQWTRLGNTCQQWGIAP
ncbi:MAG: RICIN domain-containing protein [Actinomycetota bacterium]